MHKVERNDEKSNIFVEGIRGWKWLFGKMRKNKKNEPQQIQQPAQPQQVSQDGS